MATLQQTSGQSAASGVTNGDTLKNIDKIAATPAPAKIAPRVNHALLVSSIVTAQGSWKSAINMEVAVCLAVFANAKGSNLGAKKELFGIYKEAGYDCTVGGAGKDYKTVSRRIGYAARFFDSLKKGTVEEWMGDETADNAALQSVVNHLTVSYNFRGMNDVLAASGTTPPSRQTPAKKAAAKTPSPAPAPAAPQGAAPAVQAKTPTATDAKVIEAGQKRIAKGEQPSARQAAIIKKYEASTPVAQPDAGDKGVMDAVAAAGASREAQDRRETDNSEKWIRVSYEGATVIIPKDMTPEALGEIGIRLMTVANQMKGKAVDINALNEAFGVKAAAH